MTSRELEEVDVLETLTHLRSHAFGPLLDILCREDIYLKNGKLNLAAVHRTTGWRPQVVKAEMARARELFGELAPARIGRMNVSTSQSPPPPGTRCREG
jgi:hypothetical protein